jgi:hypothetical protein
MDAAQGRSAKTRQKDTIMTKATKTIFEKRFITKAQAFAAANKSGLVNVSIEQPEGEKMWRVVEVAEHAAPVGKRQQVEAAIVAMQERIAEAQDSQEIAVIRAEILLMGEQRTLESSVCGGLLMLCDGREKALSEVAPSAAEWDAMVKAQAAQADQQATTAQVTAITGGKVWVKASSIPKPTKQVWFIADEMVAANPQVTRKEVQAECVKRGIASGTARTQYQAWLTARKNDAANAEKAQQASDRINGKGI